VFVPETVVERIGVLPLFECLEHQRRDALERFLIRRALRLRRIARRLRLGRHVLDDARVRAQCASTQGRKNR
jgi:hypothetical protein